MSSVFLDTLREELRTAAIRQAASPRGIPVGIAWSRVGLVAVAASFAAALVLVVGTIAGPGVDETAVTAPHASSAAAQEFAVLRRPQVASDSIPDRMRGQLPWLAGEGSAPDQPVEPNFGAARRAAPDSSVWVIPGAHGVCLLEVLGDGSGFGCAPTAKAESGRLVAVSRGAGFGLAPDEARVSGLLPDGASDVTLRLRDNTVIPLALHGNVYAATVSERPESVAWTDGAGVKHTVALGYFN